MAKVQELERELADERHKRYLAESNISRERELVQQEQQEHEVRHVSLFPVNCPSFRNIFCS